jgi:organic hydroperoxide reductase OsmC/OhrA
MEGRVTDPDASVTFSRTDRDNSGTVASTTHRYTARTHWSGDTGLGWDHYERAHEAEAAPATQKLTLTTAESKGDPSQLNPEQLVVMAASSCQLLWFLHVASKARVEVIEYEDDADAEMPEDDRPVRLTRITLRPRIVVKPGPTEERVKHLVHVAHEECYIANSLKTEVLIEPTVEFASVQ